MAAFWNHRGVTAVDRQHVLNIVPEAAARCSWTTAKWWRHLVSGDARVGPRWL